MTARSRGCIRTGACTLLGLALAAPQIAAAATSGEASLSVDVPAGAWRGVRLRNIPADALLSASVESDGEVAVALLDAEQYAAFPAGPKAVFRGRTDGKLDFAVRAPVSGDYYLIVDNRDGSQPRSVQVTIRGEVAGASREGALRTSPGT